MTLIAAQPFFQANEYCVCLNEACTATIPRSHVVSRIDPRSGRQEVKATCPYCRAEYEATRVMSDERWKTIAFNMTPAAGFEPIGGTPRPTFDSAPLVDHINQRFDQANDEIDDPSAELPAPPDAPAVQQLDTDCDIAAARAVEGAPSSAAEYTIDPSTSQLAHGAD